MNGGTQFGLWLKQRRKALDLTQQDLAKRVDCSLQTVVKIEAGERKPSKQVAERLAECLGVPGGERPAFVLFARADLGSDHHSLLAQAGERAPWRTLQHRHQVLHDNNLPAQLNPFVGREKQVIAAANLLRRPGMRLLSMTGPPGIGKTRLALQVAMEMLPEFESGVYMVPLAAVHDSRMVASAIAQTLGVREAARRPLLESLKNYLRDKRMLLVLDNFEQVVAAGPAVIEMLEAARWLKVLVTSRSVLHLYGEYELRIPPLSLPPVGAVREPPVQSLDLVRAESSPPLRTLDYGEYEAVELFIERALAVRPDFALGQDNARAVAEICRRLDGLPLAIELAAARVKFLPPRAILGRLQGAETGAGLKLLAGGAKNLPARQRTLRGAIAWSYDLLDHDEQALFRRLSVFVGGCTLEAANSILDFGLTGSPLGRILENGIEDDKSKILPSNEVKGQNLKSKVGDILTSLVDKNLLRQEEQAGEGEREPRYRMLETIREYALERLEESGEREDVSRRHAEYYLALAERAEPELRGPHQAAWLDRLEAEHDNLRAVLRGSGIGDRGSGIGPTADPIPTPASGYPRSPIPGETALRMAGVLGWFWFRRGYISEGRERLARALALTSPESRVQRRAEEADGRRQTAESSKLSTAYCLLPTAYCARALYAAGRLADHQGDHEAARALYGQSLAIYEQLGDRQGAGYTLSGLAFTSYREGNRDEAGSYYRRSLEIFREIGPEGALGVATSVRGLGDVALNEGDYDLARSLYVESLGIFKSLGDKYSIATLLNGLGNVALDLGDYVSARSLYEEGLAIFQELGYKYGVAGSLLSLGEAARCLGDYDAACSLNEQSLKLWRELGDKWNMAMTMHNLGHAVNHQGDLARAGVVFAESLVLFREAGAKMGIAMCLAGLAGVDGARAEAARNDGAAGYAERAARLFGAAEALLEQIGAPLQAADLADYERNLAAVRSRLTERRFATARQDGHAMAPEQAIAYALG